MFLKKLKNNNKGMDMAFIATNYILVLVIIIFDYIRFFNFFFCYL